MSNLIQGAFKSLKSLFGYKCETESYINILLLGETGIGKSTFVNAFANYLVCKSFEEAEKGKLMILIPTKVVDERNRSHEIGKKDRNEYEETGKSATQDVKTYVFPIGQKNIKLRIIDTPGLADTRGIEQDEMNCEMILDYISTLEDLHAFCIVMKPNVTRITAQFEYCIKQILTRLEKSAANNIMFLITNTRGSDFKGGDTMPRLKKFVDQIKKTPPYVEIPLKLNNIFCFENDCFHYLAAVSHNIKLKTFKKNDAKVSWEKSSKEAWRLIYYISNGMKEGLLPPHKVQNTVSINEARRLIIQLCQPLAEITQAISDNIDLLNEHEEKLRRENQSLEEMKQNMYIPGIKLETIEIDKPITVCTDFECMQVLKIESKEKYHYTQKCHDPCYLENVPREIIGDQALRGCWAMNNTEYCRECKCHFSKHMHVYYLTKPTSTKIEDENIINNISTKENALMEVERIIKDMRKKKQELEEEHQTIINITAQFVHFLQHNAITPFDDSYKSYITYLIKRQESRGKNRDQKEIENLKSLLQRHEAAKASFDRTLKNLKSNNLNLSLSSLQTTAQDILDAIQILFTLKHNGSKIKEIYDKQKNCRQKEYKSMNRAYEYTSVIDHEDSLKLSEKKRGKGKNKSFQEQKASDNSEDGDDESGGSWLFINF